MSAPYEREIFNNRNLYKCGVRRDSAFIYACAINYFKPSFTFTEEVMSVTGEAK